MDEMPPGYRFYPTEEELVSFYLNKKLQGTPTPQLDRVIPLLDIYNFNPWDLPQYAGELCHGDPEQWFFFIPRQEKEARGGRPNRLTTTGYWKATGSPGYVYSKDDKIVGLKRTMVFYKGRAPAGRKTQWKMNEYKAIHYPHQAAAAASSSSSSATPKLRQEMSLCRVYIKSKCLRAFDRRPSAGPPLIIGETSTTHQAQSTTITTAGGGYDQAAAATATAHDHNYYQKTSTTHQAQSTTITTAGGGGYDQAAAATATATSHDHNYYQNPTLMTEIITSSPDDTSSSGDPTPMEADATAVDNESLWDLDQLNWFLNQI